MFVDVLLGLALVASAAAFFSLARADAFGRRASRHLPRDEHLNYRRNLLLLPHAIWVEPLLGGTGTEDHRRAVTHMRRVHLAGLAFVVACIVAVRPPTARAE